MAEILLCGMAVALLYILLVAPFRRGGCARKD
jgi:hypothetical protein